MGIFRDTVGPREIIIPEQRYKSCSGCKYYEYKLLKSGMDPVYHSVCNHPEIAEKNIGAKRISDYKNPVETPEWCPFLQIQNQVETINTEI